MANDSRVNTLLQEKTLLLPKTAPKKVDFITYTKKISFDYLRIINDYQDVISHMQPSIRIRTIIERQTEFIDGLNDTIKYYLNGQPSMAYSKFNDTISARIKSYRTMMSFEECEIDESFFRLRIKNDNYPMDRLDMFHIPYEKRINVSTQRYSIPGFPSLYLSKNVYTAWEELGRPNLYDFNAVRFEAKKQFQYLDLTPTNVSLGKADKNLYKYLMTWPLIALCSIKSTEPKAAFKPEYIVPQILLQWVRNNNEVDGIKYVSAHIKPVNITPNGEFYNFVLPVKENRRRGHCRKLASIFAMTEPMSKTLLDLTSGGGLIPLWKPEELEFLDRRIPYLELIPGTKTRYSSSALSSIEQRLEYMPTKGIRA